MLTPATMTSDAGTPLTREGDGSVFAATSSGVADVFRVSADSPLKPITAMRLELLADARLPGNGPGYAGDGSFAITRVEITRAAHKADAFGDVPVSRARATAEEKGSPASGIIGRDESHPWSAEPGAGLPVDSTFYFGPPAVADGPFSVVLHQPAGHSVGRFRLWVTSNVNPDAAARIPDQILAILKTPDATRSPAQKQRISDYFRSTTPSLVAMRDRMAELRAQAPVMPPRARRNQSIGIPVMINRAGGFNEDVSITLEGFAAGNPKMIARQIKVTPLILKAGSSFGLLTIQPEAAADLATRMAVIKAEAKVGDDVITQYSTAFPLTVQTN